MPPSYRIAALGGAALMTVLLAAPANAGAASEWVDGANSRARLISGGVTEEGELLAAIHILLDPGWKTYWRAPGEAGIAPHFDWSASASLEKVTIDWPRPRIFSLFGYRSYGYQDELVLPVRVAASAQGPLDLRLSMFYGVCGDVCVPEQAELSLSLDPGEAPLPDHLSLIDRYRALTPITADAARMRVAACDIKGAGEKREFHAELEFSHTPGAVPTVIVEGPDTMWFGPIEATLSATEGRTRVTARADVELFEPTPWIDRSNLRLTIFSPDQAVDIIGCSPRAG